jgi:glycosyltransferase involved in cell wall biosynthesis
MKSYQNRSLNIIVASGGNIPSRFAHSFNVMKMAQGFYKAGHNVEVVTSLSLPTLLERIRIKNLYDFYGIDKNISVKFVPSFSFSALRRGVNFIKSDFKIAKYCKKKNVDFVYCRSYRIPYYCVKEGIPTIVETHTTNYKHPDLQKIYQISNDSNFIGLVTISDAIKKEHVKRGIPEEKVFVFEDGVDLDRFEINDDMYFWRNKLGLPEDKNLVIYCGQLYKEKGIEHILLTAKKLIDENMLFMLVGGFQNDIDKWKRYCKEKLISNVVFKGFINNSDIPKYLKAADVLIMPYQTDISYNVMDITTTSPMKLFEYMASKRPIVTTNIATISKIIEHNKSGMLAEPNNMEQLAAYTLELIKDKEKSKRISTNAFEDVRKYEWCERCRKIIQKVCY